MKLVYTDPFAIELHGVKLTVYPQEDGIYKVFKGSNKFAVLHPIVHELGISWETKGWIDQSYVNEIGKLIEQEHVDLL